MTDIIDEFKSKLAAISFVRAGWDFYDMPSAEKAREADMGQDAMSRAREIWRDNQDRQDELRAAFKEVSPLATLDEITREAP